MRDMAMLLVVVAVVGCTAQAPGPVAERVLHPLIGGEPDEGHPAVGLVAMEYAACTGTLITPRIVLTAAHCAKPDSPPLHFVLGSKKGEAEAVLEVETSIQHPSYDPLNPGGEEGMPHDIAIIVLKEPAEVEPLPFRTAPIDCLEGTTVRYVGYGLTDPSDGGSSGNKNQLLVTIDKIGESGFWSFTIPGAPENACPGDSGGPAFVEAGGRAEVAGVMSLADKWCEWQSFSVRTDVHAAWLLGQIETYDPEGLAAQCGDGHCGFAENGENCAADCDKGDAELGQACMAPEDCKANLLCAPNGEESLCTHFCAGPENGTGCPCGYVCSPHTVTPDDGEPLETGVCLPTGFVDGNCGNGTCDAGEDHAACPADCLGDGCGEIGATGCCDGEVAAWCDGEAILQANCASTPSCGFDANLGRYGCGTAGEADPANPDDMVCPPPGPACGDGICQEGETQEMCPLDCLYPGYCGDGDCSGTEDFKHCPEDCQQGVCDVLPPAGCCVGNLAVYCYMGDQQMVSCDHHPACGWNDGDEGYTCGTSGEEDPEGELPMFCNSYLAVVCGDGECQDTETWETCPEDCDEPEPGCGDGECAPGEDFATCPADCYQSGCGKVGEQGCCKGELLQWCEFGGLFMVNCEGQPACGWSAEDDYYWCGTDGSADPEGLHLKSCEALEAAFCGDDFCDVDETVYNCSEDCAKEPEWVCGDGICEGDEDASDCPADCSAEAPPEPIADVPSTPDVSTPEDVYCTDCAVEKAAQKKKKKDGGCSAGSSGAGGAGWLLLLLLLSSAFLRRGTPDRG